MHDLRFQELESGEKAKAGALGAALTFLKKLKKVGGPLEYGAEFLHPPSSRDYHWNESFYFNFTDPESKTGGWTRIGILPNQENDLGAMMLYAGGSRILAFRQDGRTIIQGDEFRLESLEYHRLEPLKKWRLLFQGDMAAIDDSMKLTELGPDDLELEEVEVDLTFEGMSPCFDFKSADPRAVAEMLVKAGTRFQDLRQVSKVSSEHYEQAGRVNGTIKIGGKEISFNGSGHRDHSWGLRDWAAPRLWTWLTCQFGDELAFNMSRVAIASVDIINGFVSRGGNNYPIRRAVLETEFESDGITQKKIRFMIEDSGGKTIEVTGDVMTVAPLQLESNGHITQVNEALTEYHYGDKVGYGIAEYLHQLGSRT